MKRPLAVQFGRNLAYLRKLRKISQEELAFRAGLHRTEVGIVERGHRLVRIDTLIKLCGALGATPDELLDGLGWTPSDPRRGHFLIGGEPES
jgi:transcriptional regulator with XRE-family HTH domain